jgi:bifunctional UDP-N-acetylglucosamine pyrophosphorylase/glucosamine-1-phosphate N-acetyltransferase
MTRTLLVPAAGKGSRLGSDLPKWRVPVAGRPMLDYVLDRHRPYCDHVVLVVAPESRAAAETRLAARSQPGSVVVQPDPTGMLDAILLGRDAALQSAPDRVWITWCDQVAISVLTATRLAARDAAPEAPTVIMPTVRQDAPYIHFDRDANGRLTGVRQRREGDAMPPVGESDAGLFSLSAAAMARLLPAYAARATSGAGTGERNFLPFLAWVAGVGEVETFPADPIEAVGINTRDDLARLERHLKAGRSKDRPLH